MIYYFLVAFTSFLFGFLGIMIFFPKFFHLRPNNNDDLSQFISLAMQQYGGGFVLPVYYIIPELGVMHQVWVPIRGIDAI